MFNEKIVAVHIHVDLIRRNYLQKNGRTDIKYRNNIFKKILNNGSSELYYLERGREKRDGEKNREKD